jgi:hypothetical protein
MELLRTVETSYRLTEADFETLATAGLTSLDDPFTIMTALRLHSNDFDDVADELWLN